MSIPGSASPLFLASTAAAGTYDIPRSLRFNSADSSYLNRTPSSAGNRKTWTWAGWVKRSGLGAFQDIWGNGDASALNGFLFRFDSGDKIDMYDLSGSVQWRKVTTQVFRDTSAWYHFVISYDTTNGTAGDRVRLYVNGERITAFSSSSDPSLNYDGYINNTNLHAIGRTGQYNSLYLSGYLADVHFIDGQALAASDFGEYDSNSAWQPIEYAGTYGTNGFKLDFSDTSSNAALGTDTSSNGNTWTVNNLSVAAGAGNDALRDSPVNGDSANDTGAGGELTGNYATLNPLGATHTSLLTFSNGNLECSATGSSGNSDKMAAQATIGVISGKFYWEASGMVNSLPGLAIDFSTNNSYVPAETIILNYNGTYYNNGSATAPSNAASWTSSDVIGVALNMDDKELTFYKNGVAQGTFTGLINQEYFPSRYQDSSGSNSSSIFNFGQRSWAYAAPTNFKALCTANLSDPTIADGSTAFDTKLYTGNGSTQTVSGLNFSPDLVWGKSRSYTGSNALYDSVRGATKYLTSNGTGAEVTVQGVTAFNSDGFTLGNDSETNFNAGSLVAWAWDGGSSTVTNTDGSISAQVRANPSAGFSIVTYTGNATSGSTVGHGLNAEPELIICKNRSTAVNWVVYHKALGATKAAILNTDAAPQTTTNWANTAPTSSVFSVGGNSNENGSSSDQLAYCFAPVEGYSSFGSFIGNINADGPFAYCGFRPKWVMLRANSADWYIFDTDRGYNGGITPLFADTNWSEQAYAVNQSIDILSNGFKIRGNSYAINNPSTVFFVAFAEHPFKTARAR